MKPSWRDWGSRTGGGPWTESRNVDLAQRAWEATMTFKPVGDMSPCHKTGRASHAPTEAFENFLLTPRVTHIDNRPHPHHRWKWPSVSSQSWSIPTACKSLFKYLTHFNFLRYRYWLNFKELKLLYYYHTVPGLPVPRHLNKSWSDTLGSSGRLVHGPFLWMKVIYPVVN